MLVPKALTLFFLSFVHLAFAASLGTWEESWTDAKGLARPKAPIPDLHGNELRHMDDGKKSKRASEQKATAKKHKRQPPTKVQARGLPHPPPPSPVPFSGVIEVRSTGISKTLLGYVSASFASSTHHWLGTTSSTSSALRISGTSSSSDPIELTVSNSPDAAKGPFLGFAVSQDDGIPGNDLSGITIAFCYMTGTKHSAANAPPSQAGNSYSDAAGSESTIWTYDTQTKQLTAQWVNSNHSPIDITLFYIPAPTNALVITAGNSFLFGLSHLGAVPVTLTVASA